MTYVLKTAHLTVLKIMIVGITLGLVGCDSQMQSITKASCASCDNSQSNNGGQNNPPNPQPAPVDPWPKVQKEMTGYANVAGKSQKLIGLNKADKAIVLTIPFADNILPELEVEIPQLPGAKLVSRLNAEQKTEIQFSVPIKYVLHGGDVGDPERLPNGDPLPQIPGGELPAFEISIPIKNVTLHAYLGAEVLGIYVEVPFDPYIKLTLPIKTNKKDGSAERTLGYLTSIPVKKPYRGGFFLSLKVPDDLARALDELLNSPE
ncbi:MAG: hypothetical protein A4S09_04340 [Proteobacteria bacterium SG_bin7]|nr:MAG: hypothetical protein A4S09_04340 [Proteobacteria bacterium SG_bin7]